MATEQSRTSSGGFVKFIACLQVIGIVLVVAGHSLHEYPDGQNGTSTLFFRAVYSFHMPLFFFVSGLLMITSTRIAQMTPRYTATKYIARKARQLLIPYVVLTVVTYVPRVMLNFMADDEMDMSWQGFLLALTDPVCMPITFFWFIQVSFILLALIYGVLYAVCRLRRGVECAVIMLCLLFICWNFIPLSLPRFFSLYMVPDFGLYVASGCAYGLYSRSIDKFIPWTRTWFLLLSFAVWGFCFRLFVPGELHFVCALAGIVMCISLAKIIEARGWTFTDHLMSANYLIFLLSWYFNVGSQQVLSHFVSLPWWVYSLLSLISGIYIPWLGYRYLEHHQDSRWVRLTSYLLGQTFRKSASY